jgi:hypothetical protein
VWDAVNNTRRAGTKAAGNEAGVFWLGGGATDHGRKSPLTDVKGNHYKDSDTPIDLIEEAYARYRLGMQQETDLVATPDAIPLADVLLAYLAQQENGRSTFEKAGRILVRLRVWAYLSILGLRHSVESAKAH